MHADPRPAAGSDDDPLPADLAPLDHATTREQASEGIDPHQHASVGAKEAFASAERAAREGDEAQAVNEYLRCAAAAESAHEWFLVAMACERVGDFLLNPKPPCDLQRALRMYRRAAAAYETSGLSTEARELAYRVSVLRMRRAEELRMPWLHRAELFLYWLTAGFGYRPMRVIATAIAVILLYGLLYWMIGGSIEIESKQVAGLLDSIYFSGITFATVGYGDLIPAPHARLIALTEGFLGAFLMGFFVVVLAHRLARV